MEDGATAGRDHASEPRSGAKDRLSLIALLARVLGAGLDAHWCCDPRAHQGDSLAAEIWPTLVGVPPLGGVGRADPSLYGWMASRRDYTRPAPKAAFEADEVIPIVVVVLVLAATGWLLPVAASLVHAARGRQ